MKLKCTITGIERCINKNQEKVLLKSFGTLEELCRGYVSRDGKRYLKQGYSTESARRECGIDVDQVIDSNLSQINQKQKKKEKREVKKTGAYFWRKADYKFDPDWMANLPKIASSATETACLYPNVYLDRGCENCPVYNRCRFFNKRLSHEKKVYKPAPPELMAL